MLKIGKQFINLEYFDDAEPIAEESLIVGREDVCGTLKWRANYGYGSIIITAPRGYGKTTMLLWAKKYAYDPAGKFTGLILDGKSINCASAYFHRVSNVLAKEILKRRENFSDKLCEYARMKLTTDLKKYSPPYEVLYSTIYEKLLEEMEKEGVNFPIYIFADEMNAISYRNAYEFRDFLKAHLSLDKRIKWIITMQLNFYLNLHQLDEALADRFPTKISLRVLNPDEVKELIRKRLLKARINYEGDDWYPFTEEAVEVLAEECGGVPRNAVRFSRLILEVASGYGIIDKNERITGSFVKQTLRKFRLDIYSSVLKDLGYLAEKIHDFLLSTDNGCANLVTIANAINTSKQRARYWLLKLIESGYVVQKERGVYCLAREKEL